ncbi:hypothetical protein M422DRAFT_36724 [Sphaerobolus stellatus SS14]|uniref:BTB domain-containing protein n=1 Tax=Sphaerobolus stellatus (strain SS14) TaxID=990650 RepID=A0A0C9TK38_SPHS4|nr:hypothetical protein M422DRAFT_36724 [Sphaerobolus stellatus SS14]
MDALSFTAASAVRKYVGTLTNAVEMGERLSVGASGVRVVESGVMGIGKDMWGVFEAFVSMSTSFSSTTPELAKSPSLTPDAYLELADRRLPAHSVVLRSRCFFYKRFFDSDVWTRERWSDEGMIGVDIRYLE